jgi:hypothetical protein
MQKRWTLLLVSLQVNHFRSTDIHGYVQNTTRLSCALCLYRTRNLFGAPCRFFDQPLGLYTDSFPVAVFSGDLLRHCSYLYVADGRPSTGFYSLNILVS